MKLLYTPLKYDYRVSGTKECSEGNSRFVSEAELLVEPRFASLFFNYQKLRITRKTVKDEGGNALARFAEDAANALQYFELELTPKGEPHYLANHEALNKKWISGRVILNSKYTGEWAKRQLAYMTDIFGNEKKLRLALLQDFCLNELYNRNIFKIVFDNKTYKARQTCTETALDGIPLVFEQQCTYKQYSNGQALIIEGNAPLNENSAHTAQLCRGKTFEPQDITDITQRTVYKAAELVYVPETIETIFRVNGKDGCLKETRLTLNISKIRL